MWTTLTIACRWSGIDEWLSSAARVAEVLQPSDWKPFRLICGRLLLAIDCDILCGRLHLEPIWTKMDDSDWHGLDAHWGCNQYLRCQHRNVGSWKGSDRGRCGNYESTSPSIHTC